MDFKHYFENQPPTLFWARYHYPSYFLLKESSPHAFGNTAPPRLDEGVENRPPITSWEGGIASGKEANQQSEYHKFCLHPDNIHLKWVQICPFQHHTWGIFCKRPGLVECQLMTELRVLMILWAELAAQHQVTQIVTHPECWNMCMLPSLCLLPQTRCGLESRFAKSQSLLYPLRIINN